MKDSGSPPPPPDPTLTANAQSGANIATAIANARLNRVNQSTPWGSISYTQGPPDANGVPSYSSQIQLSPMQQQLLEQQQQQSAMRGQIAQQIMANSGGSMSQPLDLADLPGIYSPTGGGHGTTWMGNPHSAPVGMAVPQVPPPAAPAMPAGPAASPATPTPGANPLSPGSNVSGPSPADLAAALRGNKTSSFMPTYQDYLGANQKLLTGGSEGGQGTSSALSESDWNNLPDAQKWQALGGGMAMAPSDPRYAAIAQGLDMSGGNGHLANLLQISPGAYKPGMLTNNKNQVDLGNGVNASNWGNYSPLGQRSDTSSNFFHDAGPALAILGALFGGAGLVGAAGLGGGAAVSGAEATAAGGITGGADIAGSGAGLGGGLGGASAAPGAFDAGGSTGFGGSTALSGGEAGIGVPVTDLSVQATQPSVWSQMLQNLQSGHGLLGMSTAQRTGLSLAAQMLMRKPQAGGGK